MKVARTVLNGERGGNPSNLHNRKVMNYFIEVITISKAKTDVDSIFKEMGYHNLAPKKKSRHPLSRFWCKTVGVTRILTQVGRGDVLCLQYPMKKFYYLACSLAHLKHARVATIVHDLDAFRKKKITAEQERHLMSKTDSLIVHNPVMRQYLEQQQFKGKLFTLGIFDFLIDVPQRQYATPHKPWQLVYTSKLTRWRNGFIYGLKDIMDGWQIHLYGPGYEDADKQVEGIFWHGSLPEHELMAGIEADFGLVWDGSSFDECAGDWGEYLKINNPHKTSLYLRAGIPVIVWSQAAMAPFVRDNGVGFAVNSIRDISKVLAYMDDTSYATMKARAQQMGRLLGEGHFTKQAFNAATASLRLV